MAVYYKFKSAKDFDSIPIDGHFISVANLKERIFEVKHLGRGTDFDLMVSNAQTNEEYVDEAMLIPKNTSVLIRRVPGRPRKTIVAAPDEPKIEGDKLVDVPQSKSSMSIADTSAMRIPEEPEWDEFGNDLYDIPEALPVQSSNQVVNISPPNIVDEENKIKAFVDTSALDWQRQIQENVGSGRGFGRGMGGRMMGGRGMGRGGGAGGGMIRKTPPQGYVCHRCNIPGHFIQHCPTNGDPNYDIKRVKPPTGIPKSMLIATPDGSYALPSGAVAVMKPNEAAFEKEIEGLPSARSVTDFPPELRCPLCKDVMKDAVLTSKCCFSSFCDKCIRDYIISRSMCVCGATNILADDLVPNKTVRVTINHMLESTTSSADNAGSLQQVQDMESARPGQMKAPSPTQSATSKEGSKALLGKEQAETGEASGHENEGTGAGLAGQSLENRALKNVGSEAAAPESASAKEPTSQESGAAGVPEEEAPERIMSSEQGKKKKKKKARVPGAGDMQWRAYPDVGAAENFGGMPMGPYNPVFPGGMPWGMDGYLGPLHGGAMPLMGYMPGPFDVPYGAMMPPQDPYAAAAAAAAAAQGFMMPVLPQMDLSELSMAGAAPSLPPPGMSREEVDARKAAEFRRRRSEADRRSERGRSRDRERDKDARRDADVSPTRSRPRSEAVDRGKAAARAPSQDRPDRTSARTSSAGRGPSAERSSTRTASGGDKSKTARTASGGDRPKTSRTSSGGEKTKKSRTSSSGGAVERGGEKTRSRTDGKEKAEKSREDHQRQSPSRRSSRKKADDDDDRQQREREGDGVPLPLPLPPPPPPPPLPATATAGGDRKHKGSVFSRISFPELSEGTGGGGGGGSSSSSSSKKKRRTPEEAAPPPPPPNGVKEQDGHRKPPSKGSSSSTAVAAATSGRRGGGGSAAAASEEQAAESDEDYHFKRRPAAARHEDEDALERVGPTSSKASRDRDRDRDRDRNRDRDRPRDHDHHRAAKRR